MYNLRWNDFELFTNYIYAKIMIVFVINSDLLKYYNEYDIFMQPTRYSLQQLFYIEISALIIFLLRYKNLTCRKKQQSFIKELNCYAKCQNCKNQLKGYVK